MFYELTQLAIGNLNRARTRLLMTSGGVLVGTTAVILLIAFTNGLQAAAEAGIGQNQQLTQIYVYPNYGPQTGENVPQLDVNAVQTFWRIPGIAAVIPTKYFQGGIELRAGDLVNYGQIMGVDPALLPYLGVTAQQGELHLGPGEVIFGGLVGEYFSDPQATEWQPIKVDLFTEPFRMIIYNYNMNPPEERRITPKVSAILATGNDYDGAILMPLTEVLKLNEWMTGQETDPETFTFDQIVVRAASRETTNDVSQAIRDLGYGTSGLGDFLNEINKFFSTMRLMLGAVGGVALLVAAFGVANTMTMAILERTKEIGLMKAVGARDGDVLTVFLIEAGLVGFVGGLAGVGLSYFLQNVINQAVQNAPSGQQGGIPFLPFDPSQIGGNLVIIPAELAVFAIALATAVGLGAGLFPALRAARLVPVIALKQE
jgi:putative ABC transport system permease protein